MCVNETCKASLGPLRSFRLTRLASLGSLGVVTWWYVGVNVVRRLGSMWSHSDAKRVQVEKSCKSGRTTTSICRKCVCVRE